MKTALILCAAMIMLQACGSKKMMHSEVSVSNIEVAMVTLNK